MGLLMLWSIAVDCENATQRTESNLAVQEVFHMGVNGLQNDNSWCYAGDRESSITQGVVVLLLLYL